MFDENKKVQEERKQFLTRWQSAEKRVERIGGLLLILAGALVLAFDQPGDQLSALFAATFIAFGMMVILSSRRSASKREYLYFLSVQQQKSRAIGAAVGASFTIFRAIQMNRPLLWIIAAVLAGFALWYRWRAGLAQQYDTLFEADTADEEAEDDL